MVRSRVATAGLVMGALIGFSVWLAAAQHDGAPPAGDYIPRRLPEWRLAGPDAERLRAATLLRAAFRTDPATIAALPWHTPPLPSRSTEPIACRFLNDSPTGTTA